MRDDLTEIVFVVDMSGSMGSIRDDAVGGFNNFVEEQKKLPGEANMTVVFFNGHGVTTWQENAPVKDMPVLGDEYQPSWNTPLLDAVGNTINSVGKRLADMDEDKRPGAVMLVIVTDGQENSSREFTKAQVKEMIQHQQEKYGWTVTFLGANVDAFAEAQSLGISQSHSAGYTGSKKGIRAAYGVMSASAGAVRQRKAVTNLGRQISEDEGKN
jgi:hypothetical protein